MCKTNLNNIFFRYKMQCSMLVLSCLIGIISVETYAQNNENKHILRNHNHQNKVHNLRTREVRPLSSHNLRKRPVSEKFVASPTMLQNNDSPAQSKIITVDKQQNNLQNYIPANLPTNVELQELDNQENTQEQVARIDLTKQPIQENLLPTAIPAIEKIAPEEPIIEEVVTQPPLQADLPQITEEEMVSEVPEVTTTAAQPQPISAATKNILQKLPNDIFPTDRTENGDFNLSRIKTEQHKNDAMELSNGIGAKVEVRKQSFDVNYELGRAYNALIRGNTEEAIITYGEVLEVEPNNKYALFGLATTYHKLGMAEQARPIYGKLLELDPYNKEALNNFLALVGEEAPEEAILYLEQLKESNTDFSPIYAQLAGLYLRQGNNILAIENMQEAVGISPENLAYKYNLAVMYDQAKQPERAVVLYRQLVKAGLDGAELPADLRDIQKRLTFLGTSP